MATVEIPILGANTTPDTTGRSWFEPYPLKATNDLFGHLVGVFADPSSGQTHGLYGVFEVPVDYNSSGTTTVVVVWTSTATSGNCRWQFQYRAISGDDTESLDQTTFQESALVTDAAPTATDRRLTATITLTASNIAAQDTVEFYFNRTDDSGTDTMAAAATLHQLVFSYTT